MSFIIIILIDLPNCHEKKKKDGVFLSWVFLENQTRIYLFLIIIYLFH